MLLVPEQQRQAPSELGPPASDIISPRSGEAVSWRLKLSRIRQWRLDYELELNGGKASVEYGWSRDGDWHPVEAGKLIPVPDPKPRYIYFRFTIQASPGGLSPWIQGLQLLIEKEPKQ